MAVTPKASDHAFPSARMVERLLMVILILTLVVVFMNRVHVVQKQAELASVRLTLGSLRTAFVLQHLHQAARQDRASEGLKQNPFELLQERTANYWGETKTGITADVPPGSWVFDARCVCVGYLPADASEFDSPSGDAMAWYRVEQPQAGPFLLTAKERYGWQGQVLN